ncbi:hypothetical protein SAMN02745121_05287 [Nannocystis exedens]|uniref:Lipoprotein n=1 Tax=Nannocystis exedens TaxID=54 RepID=A0A1I2CVS4_9BACT|nr:hypothetical protein [Nannocystis exedens]PCC68613.1 hypothetical protein NAEX_01629 [Nannocystis exedens]SFE72379.1 hypothetical protein SAMN02745121_05287 [Nannocystis exedens]
MAARPGTSLALVPLLASLACQDPAPTWQPFESRTAGVAVEFPGAPTVTVEQQLTLPVVTEVERVVLDRKSRGMLQVTSYVLLPAPGVPVESLLRIDCEAASLESKFVPEPHRELTIAGQEAIAVTGIAPPSASLPSGGWQEDRCVVLGGRMIHLMAIGPNDAETRRDGARFLDSIRPLSPPAP